MMPPAGAPVVCKSCGGVFEAPVSFTDNEGVTRVLPGHVQGDKVCKERAPKIREKVQRKKADPPPERKTVWDLTPEEKEAREAAVLAAVKSSRWRE